MVLQLVVRWRRFGIRRRRSEPFPAARDNALGARSPVLPSSRSYCPTRALLEPLAPAPAGFFGLRGDSGPGGRCRPEVLGYSGNGSAWADARSALLQDRLPPIERLPGACSDAAWFSIGTGKADGRSRPKRRRRKPKGGTQDSGRGNAREGDPDAGARASCDNLDSVWSPFASARAVVLFTGDGGPDSLKWLAEVEPSDCVFRAATAELLPLADAVVIDLPPAGDGGGCEFPSELAPAASDPSLLGQLWLIARPDSDSGATARKAGPPSPPSPQRAMAASRRCGGPELWGRVDGRLRITARRTRTKVSSP